MPVLHDFAGVWSIARVIKDRMGRGAGDLTGRARLSAGPHGLDYAERGILRLAGHPAMEAQRRYLWRPGDDGGIEVLFADGRFFHAFDPAVARSDVRHTCPPDLYMGQFDLRRWPVWQVEWRITGPRKDCHIRTCYRPAGE